MAANLAAGRWALDKEGRGWSQAQLAERADLDLTYISGIERGRRNPALNSLARLAKALSVTLLRYWLIFALQKWRRSDGVGPRKPQ
jgi:transcriptional regulator with XRE-family HTH domain